MVRKLTGEIASSGKVDSNSLRRLRANLAAPELNNVGIGSSPPRYRFVTVPHQLDIIRVWNVEAVVSILTSEKVEGVVDDPVLGKSFLAVVSYIAASTVDFSNVVCHAGLRGFGRLVDGRVEFGIAGSALAAGEGIRIAGVSNSGIATCRDRGRIDDLDRGKCAHCWKEGLGLDSGEGARICSCSHVDVAT